jgi:hypothetical protein
MLTDLLKKELMIYQLARKEFKYTEKDYTQKLTALKKLITHIIFTLSYINYTFIIKK